MTMRWKPYQNYHRVVRVKAHQRRGRPVRAHERRGPWGGAEETPRRERLARNPEELYHLTPVENLSDILQNGLVPASDKRERIFGYLNDRTHGRVFLTPSEFTADQMRNYYDTVRPNTQFALLGVNTHGMHVLEVPPSAGVSREFYTTRRVSPDRIRVITDDYRSRHLPHETEED